MDLRSVQNGDVLRLEITRVPIFASSGATSGRTTKKEVTVRSHNTDDGFLVVRDKNVAYRLSYDRSGCAVELSGPKTKYDVASVFLVSGSKGSHSNPDTTAAKRRAMRG